MKSKAKYETKAHQPDEQWHQLHPFVQMQQEFAFDSIQQHLLKQDFPTCETKKKKTTSWQAVTKWAKNNFARTLQWQFGIRETTRLGSSILCFSHSFRDIAEQVNERHHFHSHSKLHFLAVLFLFQWYGSSFECSERWYWPFFLLLLAQIRPSLLFQ